MYQILKKIADNSNYKNFLFRLADFFQLRTGLDLLDQSSAKWNDFLVLLRGEPEILHYSVSNVLLSHQKVIQTFYQQVRTCVHACRICRNAVYMDMYMDMYMLHMDMYMDVYVDMYMGVYVDMYMHVHGHVHTQYMHMQYMHMHMHMHICVRIYSYVYVYAQVACVMLAGGARNVSTGDRHCDYLCKFSQGFGGRLYAFFMVCMDHGRKAIAGVHRPDGAASG